MTNTQENRRLTYSGQIMDQEETNEEQTKTRRNQSGRCKGRRK